ncbi:DUF4040 domain-containing protein [Halobacteriaceae archaeon GCM10025711]
MTVVWLVAATAALVVAAAVAVLVLRDALAATVAFAAFSLGLAILWTALRAPDVGMTEAAVGAGVAAALFLATIDRTTGLTATTAVRRVGALPAVVAVAVAFVLGLTLPALPAVGNPAAPAFRGPAQFYLADATPTLGVRNVVTAVLVAYRGFDTFGEVTVVFAAGVAVVTLLREVAG